MNIDNNIFNLLLELNIRKSIFFLLKQTNDKESIIQSFYILFHLCDNLEHISNLLSIPIEILNNSSIDVNSLSNEAKLLIESSCKFIIGISNNSYDDINVFIYSIRFLSRISFYSTGLAFIIIQFPQFLHSIKMIFSNLHCKQMRKECLYFLTNVTSGSITVRNIIASEFNIVLTNLFKNPSSNFVIKKELCFIFTNLLVTENFFNSFVNSNCFLLLIQMLEINDNTIIKTILWFISYCTENYSEVFKFFTFLLNI